MRWHCHNAHAVVCCGGRMRSRHTQSNQFRLGGVSGELPAHRLRIHHNHQHPGSPGSSVRSSAVADRALVVVRWLRQRLATVRRRVERL